MTVRRGRGRSGGTSGSHVGAQGRPEAPTCPKSTFEVPLGTPIWEAIFGTFRDFSVFFWRCFLEGRFGWVRGAIWSGFWVDFRWICRRLSLGFLWWGEPRQMSFGCIICYTKGMSAFSTSVEKNTKTVNFGTHFSEARSERILGAFWVDFGTIFGGFGDPKSEKMRSKNDVKKSAPRSHARLCRTKQEIR